MTTRVFRMFADSRSFSSPMIAHIPYYGTFTHLGSRSDADDMMSHVRTLTFHAPFFPATSITFLPWHAPSLDVTLARI